MCTKRLQTVENVHVCRTLENRRAESLLMDSIIETKTRQARTRKYEKYFMMSPKVACIVFRIQSTAPPSTTLIVNTKHVTFCTHRKYSLHIHVRGNETQNHSLQMLAAQQYNDYQNLGYTTHAMTTVHASANLHLRRDTKHNCSACPTAPNARDKTVEHRCYLCERKRSDFDTPHGTSHRIGSRWCRRKTPRNRRI